MYKKFYIIFVKYIIYIPQCSFSKINSKEFNLTMVLLFPVKLVKDEMSSIVM